MTIACKRGDCDIAAGLPCEMGIIDFKQCSHFIAETDSQASSDTKGDHLEDDGLGIRIPWSGRALGLADIVLASARGPTRLVGLIGPYNAGKTSLLTAMFTHFASVAHVDDHDFAGSYSLSGWNQLKGCTHWPSPAGGAFPPHTPDTADRTPGLLHLAFRRGDDALRDILFTDAPGEWFTRWLLNEDSVGAQGARWIADCSSHFMFIVDRAGLAGPEVGLIRQNTLGLARKLSECRRGRPIIVAWTKSDGSVDAEVEAPIRVRLSEAFGPHISLDLHVEDSRCGELLRWALSDIASPSRAKPKNIPASAFLAYGQ